MPTKITNVTGAAQTLPAPYSLSVMPRETVTLPDTTRNVLANFAIAGVSTAAWSLSDPATGTSVTAPVQPSMPVDVTTKNYVDAQVTEMIALNTRTQARVGALAAPIAGFSTLGTQAAMVADPTNPVSVISQGAVSSGDGGGGVWVFDPTSTETPNGGTILLPANIPGGSPGRLKRVFTAFTDPRWWGAKGDGVTDDYAALQAWIFANESGSTSRALWLPAGTWRITQPLLLRALGTILRGEGFRSVLLPDSGLACALILDCGWSALHDFSINGNYVAGSDGLIVVRNAGHTDMRRLYVTRSSNRGMVYDNNKYGGIGGTPSSPVVGGSTGNNDNCAIAYSQVDNCMGIGIEVVEGPDNNLLEFHHLQLQTNAKGGLLLRGYGCRVKGGDFSYNGGFGPCQCSTLADSGYSVGNWFEGLYSDGGGTVFVNGGKSENNFLFLSAAMTATNIPSGSSTIAAGSNGLSLPRASISLASLGNLLTYGGVVLVTTTAGVQTVKYTGVSGTTLTGCSGGTGTMSTGGAVTWGTSAIDHFVRTAVLDGFTVGMTSAPTLLHLKPDGDASRPIGEVYVDGDANAELWMFSKGKGMGLGFYPDLFQAVYSKTATVSGLVVGANNTNTVVIPVSNNIYGSAPQMGSVAAASFSVALPAGVYIRSTEITSLQAAGTSGDPRAYANVTVTFANSTGSPATLNGTLRAQVTVW